ncbi:hypothetical protein A6A04_01565 [Paramagnetospirillum marisnigri]|uniref:Porin domain-containing protein n=1 Tax=Paramagnetospirillum marisnigri TaxID=1285242 RepID=A0A178MNJ4_9PROT|nr:hypothetical protein [Paramagnetospirillum marisnigri]OAN50123.1 hypothetical protein A6A04_01565 [Paramagnetospirillum marisnigri]
MACRRLLLALTLALPLMAAGQALAAEAGNRLVAGGASGLSGGSALRAQSIGETRLPLLTSGAFSVGGIAEPSRSASALSLPWSGQGNLAVGGYIAYGMGDGRLTSSLTSDGGAMRANISAAYAGGLLGNASTAALSLGSVWAKPQGFSPNPLQAGPGLTDPAASQSGTDLNLSLSLTHQMTPSFSFGGIAQANKLGGEDKTTGSGFMLGAGMGLKF